jgi:hypothetical protein
MAQDQGGSSWTCPYRSDCSRDHQAGEASPFLSVAKSLKTSSREDYQARAYSSQMVLVMVRWQAGPCKWRPTQGLHSLRTLKWELENKSRQSNNSKTAGQRQPQKKSQLTLSLMGLLWRGSWSQWKDDDEWELINPVTHGPLCPPLTHGTRADLPYKNRADLPEGRELRAYGIAALSLRVS